MERAYEVSLAIILLMGVATLASTLKAAGPYGRYMTEGQRFTLPARPHGSFSKARNGLPSR